MFSNPAWTPTILVATAVGLALTSLVFNSLRTNKKKFNRPKAQGVPKVWKHVGKVKDLYIYPLKSGRYVRLETGYCDTQGMRAEMGGGFLCDRSFILFNEKKAKFISAKQFNHLVLVNTEYKGDGNYEFSVINKPSYEKLVININDVLTENKTKSFTLYEDEVLGAFDCGDVASKWFANYLLNQPDQQTPNTDGQTPNQQELDLSIRLGFNSNVRRSVGDNHMKKYTTVYENVNNEDLGVYSDMTSYMILNERSLEDLNRRMRQIGVEDVSMWQFRGNITVDGPQAFDEDSWDWIRINDVIMRCVKPCTRCVLTCVSADTGRKQPDNQPLMMLKEYRAIADDQQRRVENFAPMFGVYAGVHRCGHVSVGDDVYMAGDPQ